MTIWLAAEAATVIADLAADLAPRARSLLELGSGNGELAVRLLKLLQGASWKGYERNAELAEQAAARLEYMGKGLSIVAEDFRVAALGNGYDLAICASGLLDLPADEKSRVFLQVHRALAPGGAFLFADAVKPPSSGIAAAYRSREREDLNSQGLSRDTIEREMEADAQRKGLWTVEEELYRLRKAAFVEVDLVWKSWNRAVFAALR